MVPHQILQRMNKVDEPQTNELNRILQTQQQPLPPQRINDKELENVNFINGNNKDMTSVSKTIHSPDTNFNH